MAPSLFSMPVLSRRFAPRARVLRRRRAMAYAAVLVLMTIMTVMGMALLLRSHTQSIATFERTGKVAAEYLAEAAANHAAWLVLHEQTPASGDIYYMHDLGEGRYGYRIQMHSDGGFATVSAVGAVGQHLARQNYVLCFAPEETQDEPLGPIVVAYDTKVDSADVEPKIRDFDDPEWGDESGSVDVGDEEVHWVELEACPVRDEMVLATLDGNDDINLGVWDGESWGNSMEFTTMAADEAPCFDVAYESLSGDAVVLGRVGSGSTPKYTVWDGTAWVHDPPINAPDPGNGSITTIRMASDPFSDEILSVVRGSSLRISVFRWNGDSFSNLGRIESLADLWDYHGVDLAYEQQSGDALVVWSRFLSGTPKYRTWNGTALGSENSLSGFGWTPRVIRLSADPRTDCVLLGALDLLRDLYVAVWDGDSWIGPRRIGDNVANLERPCFDVAWESSSDDVLVSWGRSDTNRIRVFRWTKGTSLDSGTVENGPDFGAEVQTARMLSLSEPDKVILLGHSGTGGASDLKHSLWTGSAFEQDPPTLLADNLSARGKTPFALVERLPRISAYAVYDTNADAGDTVPGFLQYRTLGEWADPVDTIDVGDSQVRWTDLQASSRGKELILGTLDGDQDLNLVVWNGTEWGTPWEMVANSNSDTKSFAVAYENVSGRALAVSRYGTGTVLKYSVWDGEAWSPTPAADAFDTGAPGSNRDIKWVVMKSRPDTNEILVAVLDKNKDIYLQRWNGSGFTSLGRLDKSATEETSQAVDIAFESDSNDALIAWGSQNDTRYCTWDGAVLTDDGEIPNYSDHVKWMRLVPVPGGNQVFAVGLDKDNDLNIALWSGTAWVDSREISTSVGDDDRPSFDVAWDNAGGEILVAWNPGTTRLASYAWTPGTALSAGTISTTGPNFGEEPSTVRLMPLPDEGGILVLVCTQSENLYATLWNDSSWAVDPPLLQAGGLSDDSTLPYALAPRTGKRP